MDFKMNQGTLVVVLLACTFASNASTDANLEKLAQANNIFALNVHKALASADDDKNIFFSPLSLATVLSMLYYGTRGESAEELRQALGYNDANLPEESIHQSFHQLLKFISNSTSSGTSFKSANVILVDNHLSLLDEYKKGVRDLYRAPVRSVDFAKDQQRIKTSVNRWVESKTGGMIKNLLTDVDPQTVMILLNAVYFKGKWKHQFERSRTTKENFYTGRAGRPRKVRMMVQSRSTFYYDEAPPEYQALELPYEGEQLSMLVLLPYSRNGLRSLEQNLTASKLQDIRQRMETEELDLLKLPKFKLEFEKELTPELRNVGLTGIFKRGSDDFSGMMYAGDSRRLAVSDVIHKCEVEVNEEGTTASGATVVGIGARGMRMRPTFVADHPFLFFIIENATGLILFMGRVAKL